MTDRDHQDLAAAAGCRGTVVVSGYPSPLYDRLYHRWHQHPLVGRADTANRSGAPIARHRRPVVPPAPGRPTPSGRRMTPPPSPARPPAAEVRYEVVDSYQTVYKTFDDLSAALNWADGAKIRRKIGGTSRPLYVEEITPDGRRRVGQAY